ncbi:MAG: hypothetical protein JNL52_03960 [Flavobacteriales bacterium]|nr:hypothetical protein [Flavobacteriales bacterium]
MKWWLVAPSLILAVGCGQAVERASTDTTERDQLVHGHLENLVGKWTAPEEDTLHVFHEEWASAGSDSLIGTGFVLSGNDTVFIEHLGLHRSAERWIYTARIPSQNDGRTISFKLTHVDKDSMCFEDPSHDFPERITYFQSSDQGWRVSLSGRTAKGPQHSAIHLRSSKPSRL